MSQARTPRVLAIDAGTTGVRALIIDIDGQVVATAYEELTANYPQPGWVECDPDHLWERTMSVVRQALAASSSKPGDLAAIGVANQRASVVAWQAADSRPICPAIIWQDVRTAARVPQLLELGVFTNAMASAAKLEWILDSVDGARSLADAGALRFGTVDSWLVWKLSGGRAHVTDASNASCTTLYDHVGGGWDEAILGILRIPLAIMPAIRASSEIYATSDAAAFGAEVPIAGIAGDQQAAMFAEMGVERGATKITFGTSGMLDINVGEYPVFSTRGAYPLILWKLGEQRTYCLEGTVITAGAAVQWLRDGLGIITSIEETAALAAQVPDSGGVWCVPALQGLGTPHMLPEARATFGGLSRGSSRAHVVRSVLEGIAFRTREVFDTMVEDAGIERPTRLRVDGGAASNDFLLQEVADVLGIEVERPACVQASALGAAYLAGLATGVWPAIDVLRQNWRSGGVLEPRGGADRREARFAQWRRAAAAVASIGS